MNTNEDMEKYEKETLDIEELEGMDIKINPDYYIHTALIKAQNALTKDDVKGGFLQYIRLIENLVILCKAAKKMPEDFEQQVNNFKLTDDYKSANEQIIKDIRLADKKLGIILTDVFKRKTATTPLNA